MVDGERYALVTNDDEECWELRETAAIHDDGESFDAVIARFYDGDMRGSPLGQAVLRMLLDSQE